MRATKLIKEIKHRSYIDRLKYLNLPTLLYRRLRGDMIMVYKLLSGIYDSNIACHLVKPNNYVTRGHRRTFFDYLKGTFIMICVNILAIVSFLFGIVFLIMFLLLTQLVYLKSLDRFCSNHACLFDYKADLAGTGSRSQM